MKNNSPSMGANKSWADGELAWNWVLNCVTSSSEKPDSTRRSKPYGPFQAQ